jgi:hypothetical protein
MNYAGAIQLQIKDENAETKENIGPARRLELNFPRTEPDFVRPYDAVKRVNPDSNNRSSRCELTILETTVLP